MKNQVHSAITLFIFHYFTNIWYSISIVVYILTTIYCTYFLASYDM